MSNVYCLLVGIDEYANPSHNLYGCINDLNSFKKYLELSTDREKLHIKVLINIHATKSKIIDAFSHFQNANDGDSCIFYYSGHGSTWDAPEFLHNYVSDKKLKSIVCHDSREKGNIDLMSLEIAYLIWEVTHKKNIQFVAITDCCHSGDITKDVENKKELKFIERKLKKGTRNFDLDALYLNKFISKSEILSNNFQIKRGQHIHLAACRSDQKAIEAEFNEERRGVFTYYLIESLNSHSGDITYENLINKIRIKVQCKVNNQSPQLFIVHDSDHQKSFLSTTLDTGNTMYEIYNDIERGWIINCGTLNSPLDEFTELEATVKIISKDINVVLNQVYPTYSSLYIDNKHSLDISEVYDGNLQFNKLDNLKVAINQIPKDLTKDLLRMYHEKENRLSFSFSNENIPSEIELYYKEPNGYFILDKKNKASDYRKDITYSKNELSSLFIALEKIANWKYLLNLNGNNSIFDSELKIEFYSLTPSEFPNESFLEESIEFTNTVDLKHVLINKKNYSPEFKLKFTNIGKRSLWISLLYLCDDYSITNRLLSKQLLKPNDSILASETNRVGDVLNNIRTKLSDQLYENGLNETKEYIKVIVSTEEFNTNYFNQSGIQSNKKYKMLEDRDGEIKLIEWETHTTCLNIRRI